MAIERVEESAGKGAARVVKPASLLGSLKDALRAAGREDNPAIAVEANEAAKPAAIMLPPPPAQVPAAPEAAETPMSAAEAARHARTVPAHKVSPRTPEPAMPVEPPTTRVVRPVKAAQEAAPVAEAAPRTRLVRGRQQIVRDTFVQDPVVGFLIVVGGPGLGASRPIFEGNNTVGRAASNRIPLDFGDETISAEAQAYIRYDSADRSFLFVPNLAKTNVVSVNEKRPAGAVELRSMDIVTFGRTQVAFLPFCGSEFDWSEISDAKDE